MLIKKLRLLFFILLSDGAVPVYKSGILTAFCFEKVDTVEL